MSPREATNPGYVPPQSDDDWNQLTPHTQIRELRRAVQEQVSPKGMPDWLKWVLAVGLGVGGGGGGLLAMLPVESKVDANKAHEILQKQIDTLKVELPTAVVKALDERDDRRRRR